MFEGKDLSKGKELGGKSLREQRDMKADQRSASPEREKLLSKEGLEEER